MLTSEEAQEALPRLMEIGLATRFQNGAMWKGNAKGRPKRADSLKGSLEQLLTPSLMKRLGQNLIDLALSGSNDKVRLDATREIYDRIEGRSRQTLEEHREGKVIIEILEKVMGQEQARYIDGEVLILDGPR